MCSPPSDRQRLGVGIRAILAVIDGKWEAIDRLHGAIQPPAGCASSVGNGGRGASSGAAAAAGGDERAAATTGATGESTTTFDVSDVGRPWDGRWRERRFRFKAMDGESRLRVWVERVA